MHYTDTCTQLVWHRQSGYIHVHAIKMPIYLLIFTLYRVSIDQGTQRKSASNTSYALRATETTQWYTIQWRRNHGCAGCWRTPIESLAYSGIGREWFQRWRPLRPGKA